MKRFLAILLGIIFTLTAFPQYSENFEKVSEIETIPNLRKGSTNTVEGYVQDFSLNYGEVGLQNVLNALENGSIENYKKTINDKLLLDEIHSIQ